MDKLALFINTAMLAMFIENAIFSRALGTSVAFYASRKKESIFGLGLGITYVIVVSSCITFFIDGWLADWQYFYVVMPLFRRRIPYTKRNQRDMSCSGTMLPALPH